MRMKERRKREWTEVESVTVFSIMRIYRVHLLKGDRSPKCQEQDYRLPMENGLLEVTL